MAAVLTAATGLGLLLRRRDGRFRTVRTTSDGEIRGGDVSTADPSAQTQTRDALAALGVTAGTPVTLLQFSSAFCAPCRATRVLCADVAARVPGVRHIEVDAETHLDEVRRLEIWRTPTVLIVDAAQDVRLRASGAPTRAQLLAAVADLLPETAVVPPA